MTAKHTPGPWTGDKYPRGRGHSRRVWSDKRGLVADVCSSNDTEEADADMLLIAAAPALADALAELLALHRGQRFTTHADGSTTEGRAEAALRAAGRLP